MALSKFDIPLIVIAKSFIRLFLSIQEFCRKWIVLLGYLPADVLFLWDVVSRWKLRSEGKREQDF